MLNIFNQITNAEILSFLLVFARIIGFISSTPSLYEEHISQRITLIIAMSLSFIIWSIMYDQLIEIHFNDPITIFMFIQEFLIGYLAGSIIRILFASLHFAGLLISQHCGMANVLTNDVNFSGQSTIIAGMLLNTCTLLVFITGTHHALIRGFVESYKRYPVDIVSNLSIITVTFPQIALDVMAASLVLSMHLAAPFLILVMLLYIGMGMVNKLVTQIPVFFVIHPLQIIVGIFIFIITLPSIIPLFFENFRGLLNDLLYIN